MNRIELAKYMKAQGLSDKAISFLPCSDKYCLVQNHDKWLIYFDERRERTFSEVYSSESEACVRLLELAKNNQ